MRNSHIFRFLAVFMIFFASCDVLEDAGKRSVVYIPVDNTRNCTDVVIEDLRTGEVLGVVPAGKALQLEVSAPIFNQQEETLLFAYTPDAIVDRILAGDTSAIPKGCDSWGTDTERIRLRDGYETEIFKVRLDPYDWWDEREFWNELSLEEQVAIDSFWSNQGVELNVEIPETEVRLK